MRKSVSVLTTTVFLLAILAFTVPAAAAPSFSVGAWSDTLPTADGIITSAEASLCDSEQVSVEIGSLMPSELIAVSVVNVFLAANDTHLYAGMNMTNVPYLANVTWDDAQGKPTHDLANATVIQAYFDNDNNGTFDDYEDSKALYYANSTFILAEDLYYDASGDEWLSDSGIEDPPDPGNITDWILSHSDTSAQGAIGTLTLEMIFEIGGTEIYDGSPNMDNGDLIGIELEYMAIINGDLASEGDGPPMADDFLIGTIDLSDIPIPQSGDSEYIAGALTTVFTIDGTIDSNEDSNSISDVQSMDIYHMEKWTSTFDIYAVNNDSHLYIGVDMSDMPYLANVDWDEVHGFPAVGVHNFTLLRVIFDNDNDSTLELYEDAKMVAHGNNTFAWADDLYWNGTEIDPLGAGFSWDSQNDHGYPPDPGDITAYAVQHSNATGGQGANGVLTLELVMPLADDSAGYDGGGLSDTVGFSIQYEAIVNFNNPGEGPPDLQGLLVGMSAGHPFSNDASDFDDLVIFTEPVSEFPLIWTVFVIGVLIAVIMIASPLNKKKLE